MAVREAARLFLCKAHTRTYPPLDDPSRSASSRRTSTGKAGAGTKGERRVARGQRRRRGKHRFACVPLSPVRLVSSRYTSGRLGSRGPTHASFQKNVPNRETGRYRSTRARIDRYHLWIPSTIILGSKSCTPFSVDRQEGKACLNRRRAVRRAGGPEKNRGVISQSEIDRRELVGVHRRDTNREKKQGRSLLEGEEAREGVTQKIRRGVRISFVFRLAPFSLRWRPFWAVTPFY